MRILRAGARAILVELDDLTQVQALHAALVERREAGDLPAVVEIVPAARTILLDGVADPAAIVAAVDACPLTPVASSAPAEVVEIPVVYDGEDLPWVAEQWGTSVAEAVELHCGAVLRAAFCGFAPGFAYLVGLPERCHLPRRPRPRPEVPAGAVAVAGEFTGVYPRPSPGGWHVIGRTTRAMWDPSRARPALVVPGAGVRFLAAKT
jgi:KipI family sensor histidine kinase inhibitor